MEGNTIFMMYISLLHTYRVMYMYNCYHNSCYGYTTFMLIPTTIVCTPEFLICFEAWAKLAQKWFVCAIGNTS